jgi:hypothetical protein
VWLCCIPVIPATWEGKQEDYEFQTSLGCIYNLTFETPISKKKRMLRGSYFLHFTDEKSDIEHFAHWL